MNTKTHMLTAQKHRVTGVYKGGAYIDLYFMQDSHRTTVPFDVINVYDYEAGRIDHRFTSVKQAMIEWRSELDSDEIDCFYRNS